MDIQCDINTVASLCLGVQMYQHAVHFGLSEHEMHCSGHSVTTCTKVRTVSLEKTALSES
jgi:hypothetical protein